MATHAFIGRRSRDKAIRTFPQPSLEKKCGRFIERDPFDSHCGFCPLSGYRNEQVPFLGKDRARLDERLWRKGPPQTALPQRELSVYGLARDLSKLPLRRLGGFGLSLP